MIPACQYRPLVGQSQGARKIHVHFTTLDTQDIDATPHHSHEAEEAMFILEGELEYMVGEQVRRIGPGDWLFFPSGVEHGCVRYLSPRMRYVVMRSVEPGGEPCCCEGHSPIDPQ